MRRNCEPRRPRSFSTPLVAFSAFSVAACSSSAGRIGMDAAAQPTCGPGMYISGNECLPLPTPGAPAPGDASVVCDAGTSLVSNVCVAAMREGGSRPDGAVFACGPGTMAQAGICVAIADAGAPQYEVRVPSAVSADGHSAVPVLALGPIVADGGRGPDVLLALSPPLGTLVNTQLSLGSLGAQTYYVPCNGSTSGCAGSVEVTMALASAPSQIVAISNPLALVAPSGVGDPSPCLTGGNVLFFDGDAQDYIHPGIETISSAIWQVTYSTSSVTLSVTTSAPSTGMYWMLDFSTSQLNQPMGTQVYVNAQRAPFATSGHPGLDISGDGRGCNTLTGSFQVATLQASGATLQAFTATFEQHCEGGTAALRGCVHYGG